MGEKEVHRGVEVGVRDDSQDDEQISQENLALEYEMKQGKG